MSSFTSALALDTGSEDGSQTRLDFNGPLAQSGNAAKTLRGVASAMARKTFHDEEGIVQGTMGGAFGRGVTSNKNRFACYKHPKVYRRSCGTPEKIRCATLEVTWKKTWSAVEVLNEYQYKTECGESKKSES